MKHRDLTEDEVIDRFFEEWFLEEFPHWKKNDIGIFNEDIKRISKKSFVAGFKRYTPLEN